MKSAVFTPTSPQLQEILSEIKSGKLALPDIQRPFIWENTRVRDLFDSMYRGYPIGYLLFWHTETHSNTKQIGSAEKQSVPSEVIVDGQQRLTSLYAVIHDQEVVRNNFRRERIHISFRPMDGRFEVMSAATRKDPEYIANISDIWRDLGGIWAFTNHFIEFLKARREVTDAEANLIGENIGRLYDLPKYTFNALVLSASVTEEQVAEVFVRINSKGKALNQSDFILTLMSIYWEKGRQDLEEFCRKSRIPAQGAPSPFNYYLHPEPDQMLRVAVALGFRRARLEHVYSILRGKDLETGQFSDTLRDQQFDVLQKAQSDALHIQTWHDFLLTLSSAGYRGAGMISSKTALIYSYAMYLLGKLQYSVHKDVLKKTISRWFFLSALTGRYSESPESAMEYDLANLRKINTADEFVAALDTVVDETFTDDYWNVQLPNDLASSSAQSPGLYAYYAALCILDAQVLFSGQSVKDLLDPSVKANKSSVERHHLFPRAYLKKQGITELRSVNQIANYALVEWSQNIAISDQSPADYYPQMMKQDGGDPKKSRFWHALPIGWETMRYEDFLGERRLGIAQVIRAGYMKLK